jgi:RNA-directed DNA polymerase
MRSAGVERPVVARRLRNGSGAKGLCYPVLDNGQPRGRSQLNKTKPYQISKHVVLEAFRRVKANGGAAGVDGESLGICSKTPANGPTVGDDRRSEAA